MNILHVVILGVVEGITEFLPISSTFHLIITAGLLGIPQNDFLKLFEVFIQSGAILSVVLLYAKDVVKDKKLMLKVCVSFIPTAIIGFVLHGFIKDILFHSLSVMLTVFILVGILFIILEFYVKKEKLKLSRNVIEITYKEAFLIGICQSLAVVPGVSRAGSVIVAMILLRYNRTDAAKYSFLLSVPTIFAASALDAIKMRDLFLSHGANLVYLLVGFVVAFITSYFVVKWLISYLQRNSLAVFGWYRIVFGLIVMLGVVASLMKM